MHSSQLIIIRHTVECRGVANDINYSRRLHSSMRPSRGDTEIGYLLHLIALLMPASYNHITPAIIIGTIVTMYRTVRTIERRMLNYGAIALRLRAHQRQAQVLNDPDDPNAPIGGDNHT